MARTVNVEVYRVRREAFLDVGQRLIQTRGYEQMTIQDLLDELDTSRGAFYHYFDSKQALLEAVVERFADAALATLEPILNDPRLTALQKLEQVLAGIARFKAEQKELVLAILQIWTSDGNALVREKVRQLSASRLGPILAALIRQGVAEGQFSTGSPEATAMVILQLMLGYQEVATQYFLARQAGTITFEEVQRSFAAYTEALERILGVAAGSARLVDEATLRLWFG